MSTEQNHAGRERPRDRRSHLTVVISTCLIPLLVLGQFALLAVVPVALVLVTTLRDADLRSLRTRAGALGAAYAAPLAIWALRPGRAPSLSKDMSPVFAGLIVLASVTLLIAAVLDHRRRAVATAPARRRPVPTVHGRG